MSKPDPLDAIHAALARTHLYVDPSLADQVSPTQLSAIKANIAAADQPVYVVIYPLRDDDQFAGSPGDLLTRLHDAHPAPGVYLSTTTFLEADDYSGVRIYGHQWGIPGAPDGDLSDYQLPLIFDYEHQTSIGATFQEATSLLAAGPDAIESAYDRAEAQYRKDNPSTSSTSSSTGDADHSGGGDSTTAIVVLVVVLAVVLTIALGFLVRLRPERRPRTRVYALPESAMDHIREANDRRLEQRARDAVLALGERIDAADMRAHQSAASWQSALDAYDAARQVIDRRSPPDVLDVVGSLVLSRRGDAALSAALADRTWTPARTCYLDPLHGLAEVTRAVQQSAGGGRLEVPLCDACRADLDAGRRPDILDVERRGRPVHYFDAKVEPWASTGYGAFGDDLVEALHREH